MSGQLPSFAEGLVGVVLDGRYRLDAVLGEGGMGSVFRAQHLAMDRRVAVKLLKPHLTSDNTALLRFAAEARRTLRVDSPHAVKVLDFGVTEGKDYYIVLEYLDGRTVQRELEVDGPFAPARVIHIARQALHALGAAHAGGLVHRDIKPDNILLMRDGDDADYTKLLDFGVAKLMQGAAVSERSAMAVTAQGMVFGTPEFMSPEQACGLPLDGRSDLYSLAATMFAMLTGCGLFDVATPILWLTAHARTPPPHLAQMDPALAPFGALDDLLQRCLAKRAEQRPASAAAMAAELEQIGRALSGDAAASSSSRKAFKTMFSASVYVEAVASGEAEATGPRASGVGPPETVDVPFMRPETGAERSLTDGVAVVPAKRGRGVLIGGAAAVLVAGLIVATIVVAANKGDSRAMPRDAGTQVVAAPTSAPPPSPSPPPTPPPTPSPPPAPIPAKPPEVRSPKPEAPKSPTPAEIHVRAAEDAQRAGNRLRQMAEADAARRLDPSNAKATYLLADVLLADGDLDRGCQYLHAIKHFPLASVRARTAGCRD